MGAERREEAPPGRGLRRELGGGGNGEWAPREEGRDWRRGRREWGGDPGKERGGETGEGRRGYRGAAAAWGRGRRGGGHLAGTRCHRPRNCRRPRCPACVAEPLPPQRSPAPQVTPGHERGALRRRAGDGLSLFFPSARQLSRAYEKADGQWAQRNGIFSVCQVGFAGMLDVEILAFIFLKIQKTYYVSSFYSKNLLFLFEKSTRTSRVSIS